MKISSWLVSLCQLLDGIMKFVICLFLRVRQREVGIRNFSHFFLLFWAFSSSCCSLRTHGHVFLNVFLNFPNLPPS